AGFDACYPSNHDLCASKSGVHDDAKQQGRVVLVKLSDGSVRHVSVGSWDFTPHGSAEQSGAHISARNLEGLSTWIFASYEKVDSTAVAVYDSTGDERMRGEIVAWSLDTPKQCKRLAWSHSSWSQGQQHWECYRAQPQPSPSRDGRRILIASNWQRHVDGTN